MGVQWQFRIGQELVKVKYKVDRGLVCPHLSLTRSKRKRLKCIGNVWPGWQVWWALDTGHVTSLGSDQVRLSPWWLWGVTH